jgi:TonB family protein
MRIGIFLLSATLMLNGCATTDARDEWPSTVVTIEDVKIAKPMRLVVGYKVSKGAPIGTTVLRLHLNELGRVRNVSVLQSSGHANLDDAAINSAWDARFYPYIKEGKPVEVTLVMPMHLR